MRSFEDKLEDNEAYERSDTVILSGSEIPVASNNEDSTIKYRNKVN